MIDLIETLVILVVTTTIGVCLLWLLLVGIAVGIARAQADMPDLPDQEDGGA